MKCQACGEDVEELVAVKVGNKTRKLCDDCADSQRDDEEVADGAQAAIRGMMEYKGR